MRLKVPRWTFSLADSLTDDRIGNLGDTGQRSLGLVYNRPGTFSGVMPIDCDMAYRLIKHRTYVMAERLGDESGISRAIWSGPITSIVDDASAGTTSITATGWLDRLNHRFLYQDLQYVDITGGDLWDDLLTAANTQLDSLGRRKYTGIPHRAGFFEDIQTRTRSYQRGQNIGQAMQELSDVEDGFDIFIDPVTRVPTTRRPQDFVVRPEVQYVFGQPPHNLLNVTVTDDGADTANVFTATGSSGSPVTVDDTAAIDLAGVALEDWTSLSDVNDINIIAAYANAELVYRRYGNITYALAPNYLADRSFRLFDDFELGDQVYFSAERGRLNVQGQAVRPFTATINFNDAGEEQISELGTSPST